MRDGNVSEELIISTCRMHCSLTEEMLLKFPTVSVTGQSGNLELYIFRKNLIGQLRGTSGISHSFVSVLHSGSLSA